MTPYDKLKQTDYIFPFNLTLLYLQRIISKRALNRLASIILKLKHIRATQVRCDIRARYNTHPENTWTKAVPSELFFAGIEVSLMYSLNKQIINYSIIYPLNPIVRPLGHQSIHPLHLENAYLYNLLSLSKTKAATTTTKTTTKCRIPTCTVQSKPRLMNPPYGTC